MNKLEFLQKDISSNILASAMTIRKSVEEYLNSFDKKEFLYFSNNSNTEKHTRNYHRLLSSISENLPNLIAENARLSSLLIDADNAMNTDLIVLCEKRFNIFESFERELDKFMSSMENAISNGNPTPAFFLNSAMQFKNALDALIDANL